MLKKPLVLYEILLICILNDEITFFRRKRSILIEETKRIPRALLQGSEQSSAISVRIHKINEATFIVIFNSDLMHFRMKLIRIALKIKMRRFWFTKRNHNDGIEMHIISYSYSSC